MKIPAGWKVVLYAFALILLIQGLDVSYYLMNQKDSYLANLGILSIIAAIIAISYCLVEMITNILLFIKQNR